MNVLTNYFIYSHEMMKEGELECNAIGKQTNNSNRNEDGTFVLEFGFYSRQREVNERF